MAGASAALAGVLLLGARTGKYNLMGLLTLSPVRTYLWRLWEHLYCGWAGSGSTAALY